MAASSLPNEIVERFSGIRLERQSAGSEINDESSVRKPINLAFQDGDKRTTQILPIKPRQYQVELYQQALKKNAIIYLGTGLGKTFITVMLIKSAQINEQIQLGRRVVFLAPTQELVKQQAEYIYRQVPYKVKVYCGRTCKTGLHIDSWDKDVWAAELTNYEVLFMIPAILKRALAINAISWKSIGLLIFDEVHHAASSKSERTGKSDGSEYSQILKHFDESHSRGLNNNESTKLIGLTASLINNGSRDHLAIANSIRALERKLHATCITDLTAIESKPRHVIWTYRTAAAVSVINKTLINLFSQYAERYEGTLNTKCLDRIITLGPQTDADRRMLAYHKRLNLASSGISIAPSSFPKILKQLEPICENSGLWTLANTCYSLVNAVDKHSKASCISDAIRPVYQEFGSILREVLSAINALMGLTSADLLFEHSQPKLLCLLEILRSEHARMVNNTGPKETFSCIVFVKSRIEVVAICNWLIKVSQQIPGYDFIRADYAIGLSAIATSELACITRRKSSEQSQMLDDFRLGVLNVIVTTSVLEEGIDLPVCSTVIRYDTAETFRVYVQSRGRARQQESSFVVISELGKSRETEKALHGFYDVEALIRKIMKKDDQRTQVSLTEYRAPIVNTYGVSGSGGRWADCDHEDCFRIPEKSIHISPAVARAVLNRYFSLLSRRRPYLGGLQHELKQVCGVLFRMTIFFPSGCPAAVKESVSGRPRRTIGAAGSSAVIAAFDALYKAGEIDCHGVPVQFTEDNIDKLLADYNMAPDFSKLSKHLEGEKVERGGKCYHQYEWKLCHLNDYNIYQKKPTKNQLYKLYRIVFTRRNDQSVRQETVGYFENPTIGIIVDASQDHLANLPVTIWSHYGEFKVEYNLIDDGFEIDDKAHKAYLVYTMSLMGTFWNLQDLSLVSFPEKCLFYFVPLSTSTDDISKTRLRGNFYKRNGIGRGAIVQMNKSHTNEENSTKRFLVHEIRTDMNAHSRIPGCQETFKERLERQDIQVKDPNQPVVMVYPISKEFGRTSHGKQVRSNDRTQPVYYLSQCFECVSFEPHEAYQAYNLPEIAYQIYINVLVLDLEKRFKRATASNRSDKVEFGQQSWQIANYDANVNDDTMAVSQDNLNGDCNTSDQLKTIRGNTMANKPNQTKENRPKTTIQFDNSDLSSLSGAEPETSHYYVGDELGSTYVSSSVSDSSAPATRGRDVMPAKQTQFDGCSSDSVTSGQMYLQMANLGRPTIERINFTPLLSQPKPSSSNVSSILALPHKTLAHQQRIEEILRNFHTGMIDLHQFMGEEQVYERLGHKVDLNIKPPLKFDTRPTNKPAGDVPLSRAFIEAITTRKASSHANLEALENIGDSFLKYFTSVQLFKYLGGDDQLDEGRLTSARSRLISNEHFSHLAKKNELGYYAINHKFDRGILNAALGSYKLPVDNSLRLKDLADMFESLIGACLVYGGEYEAILAIKWLGLGHIIRADAFTRFQRHGVAFSRHQRATALARVDADELKRCMMQVMRFQSIIKYKFNDASYLVQAFTHASEIPRCTDSYERLEFLGDAILDFLVTMTLYDAGINKDPGQMTSSRSALVNNCTFAKLAIKYKFDIFIRQKNQQLFDELNRVNESAKSDPELKFLDIVDFDRISKTLADVFEAVAGAIYLDSGCSLDTVFSIYYPMLKDLIDEEIRKPTKNVIQQLYERFPGKDRIKFEFHQATGKDGKFVECAECFIDHLARGSSEGHSRKQAKMRAILKVMNNLPTIQS